MRVGTVAQVPNKYEYVQDAKTKNDCFSQIFVEALTECTRAMRQQHDNKKRRE